MKRTKGFTLAEVLITLSILGVVAAVTISSLVNHYQRIITVVKVKKMYATLSEAYERYLGEHPNGLAEITADNWVTPNWVKENLVEPYFQTTHISSNSKETFDFLSYDYPKKLNGDEHKFIYAKSPSVLVVRLKNGDLLYFRMHNVPNEANKDHIGPMVQVIYDVNGKKGPNTYGKDMFFFHLHYFPTNFWFNNTRGMVLPYVHYYYLSAEDAAKRDCINTNSDGISCAAWIVVKGNMNYLDCPGKANWETGKCNH